MKKIVQRFRQIRFSKRKEFVAITIILTLGLISTQIVSADVRYWLLLALTFAALGGSAIGLRENLKGVKWFTLLLVPTMFTVSIGLFYFLLPVRWLTRLPTALFYGIGMYAILLVENIYNIATERSIQLLRVAHAVGFLATLASYFFLLNTILSFRLTSYVNSLLSGIIVFPLIIQALWAVELKDRIDSRVVLYSFFFSLIVGQLSFSMSFWPVKPIMGSLFITTITYSLIGVGQHYFAKRLFRNTILDYVKVLVVVSILVLLTTQYQ
ncbi:hypothetical protein HY468_03445 [Candidatus Roizmanbacteria bacterium]|nr:hypothetical protein [Candidatus Roizmanbacteria bacterium]